MNLSVGAIGGLATIATGYCIQVLGLPGWLAAGAAVAIGALAGLVNGAVITRSGPVPSTLSGPAIAGTWS